MKKSRKQGPTQAKKSKEPLRQGKKKLTKVQPHTSVFFEQDSDLMEHTYTKEKTAALLSQVLPAA